MQNVICKDDWMIFWRCQTTRTSKKNDIEKKIILKTTNDKNKNQTTDKDCHQHAGNTREVGMESTTLGFGEASWQRSPGTQPEVEGTDLVRQLACNHAWKERNKFTSSAPTVK